MVVKSQRPLKISNKWGMQRNLRNFAPLLHHIIKIEQLWFLTST